MGISATCLKAFYEKIPINIIVGDCHNVDMIDPATYLPFVWLMNESDIILTDSDSIQEEGRSLGTPVFGTHEVTESPETLDAGTVKLVGTNSDKIFNNVE